MVLDRSTESSTFDRTTGRGRPQRESVELALQELGFYDRLPKIRDASRAWLKSSRDRLAAERPKAKWTNEQALAEYERTRSRFDPGALIAASTFTVATLEPQGVPYGGSKQLPVQNPIQPGFINVVGSGTGWNLDMILQAGFTLPLPFLAGIPFDAAPNTRQFLAVWEFPFVPPSDGSYRATAGLLSWGEYTLISDDGPFDSHEVNARIDGLLTTTSGAAVNQTELFSRGDDNIDEKDSFANAGSVEFVTMAKANQQIKFHAGILLTVDARGDDTFAQLDASQGIGGLMCGGLTVEQIA